MCVGGGGSVSKAVITDPLQTTGKYQQARKRVERIKDRKGQMDPAKYERRLDAAKQDLRSVRKYKDKNAEKVDDSSRFMLDTINGLLDQGNPLNVLQDLTNASQQGLQQTLGSLNQLASMAAENQQLMQQDAMRMSALIGPPPPEQSASAPVIGDNRFDGPRAGRTRRDLRIDKTQSSPLAIN